MQTAPALPGARSESTPALLALLLASGMAGLSYEIVWAAMLAPALGHEIFAVLAVLAAFFVGLALGAFTLSARIARSAWPGRWYVGLEALIGLWALVLIVLLPAAGQWLPGWFGESPSGPRHWAIAFGSTLILLLPATFAMGGTLPAAERLQRALVPRRPWVAALYSANTLGAVAGTLLCIFVLLPELGHKTVLLLGAAINFACAALAARWRSVQASTIADAPDRPAPSRSNPLQLTLLATGLLGIGYEVLVIRLLSQVLENTIYTFALLLSIYLLGTALGAAWLHRRATAPGIFWLLLATAAAVALGGVVLYSAGDLYESILGALGGPAISAALSTDLLLALLAFGPATLAMGATFSALGQQAVTSIGLGRGLGLNTLGAAMAPLLIGVVLLPVAGANWVLALLLSGYLLLALGWRHRADSGPAARRRTVPWLAWLTAALLPVIVLGLPNRLAPLRHLDLPPEGKLVSYQEGIMASVAVVEDARGTRFLKVNNHYAMGSTSSGFADHRQTHLPLLLHPAPRSALFLGVGTGMSLDAARHHDGLAVTAVELLPEALAALSAFNTDPSARPWATPPRLLASDARRHLRASKTQHDVIIADLFHPSRDGAGTLYTREHFQAVAARLQADGLFCQWLPLFQMDLDTFALIARTFLTVFPEVELHVPHFSLQQPIIGLIGSQAPIEHRAGYLQGRVLSPQLQRALVELRLNSDLALHGGQLADRATLAAYVGDGPLNTDDRPLVTYRAPAFAYEGSSGHGQRLAKLAKALAPATTTTPFQQNGRPDQFADALQAYHRARNRYLDAGVGVSANADLSTLLAQTREPLLAVLGESPDFAPAYLPLMAMARSLLQQDLDAGVELLLELEQVAPGRTDARALLLQLRRGPAAARAGSP